MKRRVLSLITALALCLSLCPVWVLAADEADDAANERQEHILDADKTYTTPYKVSDTRMIDTNGHTLTGANSSAIQVTETGDLLLKGNVLSQKGAGVEVLSGGVLRVTEPGTVITGTTYALDIKSGATVYLSAGTYTGKSAAIKMESGDLSDFLVPGYACFDTDGPILPANAAATKKLVIGQCVDHLEKTYTHTSGTTKHTWTCRYCAAEETEPCTFTFDQDGKGTCVCGNSLTITVDETDLTNLVYDGTVKPEDVKITVTLTDGSNVVLVKDTDYKVVYEPRTDAGEITVTVTGITFHGTFTKTYNVKQDQPGIKWDDTTKKLDYDGRRTTIEDELPHITIAIKAPNNEDLHPYLQYSYREAETTEEFTDGLPLDVGKYEIKAYIPESQNYKAAETNPLLTLTINKINPVITAPEATPPTFNGTSQELVTPGVVDSRAVGAEILFATSENGPYSTTIPTGVNAGAYEVWYKVEGTDNYNAVAPTKISGVEILRKKITPIVTLSDYTYLYDGGQKEPKVTVKDEDNVTVLLDTEYHVDYQDNRNVGTAHVIVTDKANGNYAINTVTVDFKITLRTQETLSITQKPNTVIYGDKFTLSTDGGSGNGDVTWKITSGSDVAKVDQSSGQVTIIGHGSATVQATKSGKDPATDTVNYDDATASWTFTAVKKPVVATVTAEDKTYNGNNTAVIHATVEQGVLPGDAITITGLTGTFSDENAGADKTVTVDTSNPKISGTNSQHYDISFSSTTVKATIHKAVVHIKTAPSAANLIYNGTAQELIATGAVVDTTGVDVEYALSENGPYSTTFPKGTDAGTYTVWYRVKETNNYTGLAPKSVDVEINKKQVTPTITLSGDGLTVENDGSYSYIYDGNAKEPVVTLTETDETIPADEYTVSYSGNINVGTATVTVTAKDDGNYTFTTTVTRNFTITPKKAQVLTAPEAAGGPLYYNTYAQRLVTAGTGYGGTMVYSKDNVTFTDQIPTETNAADYTVYYKVEGDGNHSDSDVGSVTVTIAPKTVKDPTVELLDGDGNPLVNYTYDGTAKTPTVVVKDGSTLIDADEYNLVYEDNMDAGKGTVSITDKPGGNYTVTGSATFVIVKADIVFNPAPSAATIVYDGKPHELLIPGTTSGGEVLYALNSPTSTYNAAIPEATEAGNYTVYYKVTGDKNHNDFAAQPVSVTIKRKPLTAITIELSPEGFEYDGTVKLPEVTVKDGKTVLPEEEYTWLCDVASPINMGTYTITITDATGGNYDLSGVTANTKTFTIGKIPQEELVIGGKPAVTNYGDNFPLTVGGGSGTGAVTWKATGPATVDTDGKVTITGVGEVTVTVEKAADTNYLSAQAQWTFTATPKPVTASVVVANKPYDGNTTAAVNSASITTINGDTVTIVPASITAAFDTPSAGTGKTVTLDTSKVKVTGDTAKYDISYPSTVTANITQATTTVTTAPQGIAPLTYNGQPQALVTAGVTNVGFLVYSLDGTSFSSEIPTGTDAGTYNVYYKVDGTADYTGVAVNATPISVAIDPKSITPRIELSETSYVYDGSKKEPKVTVKDGNTVIDSDQYTVTWTNDSDPTAVDVLTAAGTYTATIKNVTSGNNYTFTKTIKVEITPAPQPALHITGKPAHVYYGDTVTTLGTTGGSGNGTVAWSITAGGTKSSIDTATGVLTVKDTGSITVKAERTVPNYETVIDTWTFTVEPKQVTAEVTVASKNYDGTTDIAEGNITATVNPSDLVSGDSITITGLKGAYDDANAGTNKAVTLDDTNVSITTDAAKYTVSCPDTATADITPRSVTVTVTLSDHDLRTDDAGNYYYVYNGTERKPAVTVKVADANAATLAASDYEVTYANNQNVSDMTANKTASVTITSAAGGNYTFADTPVKFEIRKAIAELTSSPQAKVLEYTGAAQELVTVGTAAGGHVEYALDGGAYSADIPKADQAGTYVVRYKAVGDGNYEDSETVGSVSVTIKPKEVISPVITVSGTYTYNGSPQEPSGTAVEVKDGTTTIPASEYNLSYTNNTNAGTATVYVINANGGNYIVNGTATFTIEKDTASVVTAPEGIENLPYNGTPQELVKAGAASGGMMVYSLSQTGEYSPVIPAQTAVDSYTVWYKVQGDSNHNDTDPDSVNASIIVNTVNNPTVQVTPESVTYNGKKQKPTVTVIDSSSGLLIDGSEYTVTYTDAGSSTVTDLINVGIYTLTIKGTDTHYTFTATAKFEILPADQTPLTITNTREHVYYGDTIQLGTTGGNGTVEWKVDDGSAIASINNGLLTIKGVGSVTVTATSKAAGYNDQIATWPFVAEKKPVTAVVTAAAKTYDGDTDATVTAALQSSDLVSGDTIKITLSGTFEDPNVGTDKKVNVDSRTPDFTGSIGNYANYNITYPATATASILRADIDLTKVIVPTAVTGLEYTGLAQALVTAGSATGGSMEYSLDNITYSASLPTGTDADSYDVWYRVKGDGNHNDTAGTKLADKVTIAPQDVTAPIIEFDPSGVSYDGAVHKPSVTVKDKNNRVIPAEEYTVTYSNTDWKTASSNAVKHEVTVTDNNGGSYNITAKTEEFTISPMGQSPLSITNQPGRVQYGDTFTLSAVGGSGTGAVSWSISGNGVAQIDQNGLVKVLKSGSATVTATKLADGNYGATTATWSFSAEKKPVAAVVTARDKEYDTTDTATLVITWKDGDLLNGDTIDLDRVLTGTFNNANAGTGKTVTITGTVPSSDKYAITYNTTTTASITQKAASVSGATATELNYTGSEQALVSGVTATDGTLAYSRDGSYYTLLVPKETNAGTYTVWYKAQASGNYTDSPAVRVDVTIKPKSVTNPVIELSPESFDYDGTAKKPDVVVKDGTIVIPAGEYTVSYSNNTAVGTATVTISDNAGGNYTVSGSENFTIKTGRATLTTAPQAKVLTYTGAPQELVSRGAADNGTVVYSQTETGSYTTTIPRQTNAGNYEVWYKVQNTDGTDATSPQYLSVTIARKTITAEVLLNPEEFTYSGDPCTPDVFVLDLDSNDLLDPDADYTVRYMSNTKVGTARVIVMGKGNYSFSVTTTFEIVAAKAKFTVPPMAISSLAYNGTAQALVTTGTAEGGTPCYSLDGVSYLPTIPTAINRGSYTVFAKVQGDSTHEDGDVVQVPVTIGVNTLTADQLTVTLSSTSFPYTGSEQKPTVTVTDDYGNVISADEYTVTYSDNVNVGTATVSIKSKTNGNYSFTASAEFQIIDASQTPLAITGKKDAVYYGDTLSLGTTGGSGSGAVTWSATGPVNRLGDGQYKITSSGSVTITATKGSSTDVWTFYAQPKPVTATVTAANKVYDGNTNATLTVTLSGLLPGETVDSVTAQGQFADENVGTNKTVIITGLTIPDAVGERYAISHSGAATASITPAPAAVTAAPTLATGSLTYNGGAQALLANGGTAAAGGSLMYSLEGRDYGYTIPTGTDAKTYTVWYKVEASDENHKDSAPVNLGTVTIGPNIDTPTVLCMPSTFQYDGTEKTPTVVVRDSAQRVIPESEYTVSFTTPRIAADTYTVTVTDKLGGNYKFDNPVTGTFEIVAASQNPLSIVTDIPTDVHYGDTFRLSAAGGSGSGAIQWSIAESGVATITNNGVVTVTGTGGFTVQAYREGADGYNDSNTDSVPFVADPKPVTPTVTAENKPYDGTVKATLKAVWKSGDLVGNDTIALTVTGVFATADAGTNRQVTIQSHTATGTNADKYAITWPDSTTASIYKVDAVIATKPTTTNPTYTGTAQPLVTDGTTVGGIGKIEYSLDQNGAYSETIPTATNAGTYTVWYKVADSVNYTGIPAAAMEVEIAKANPIISTSPTASTGTEGQSLKDITFSNGGAVSVGGRFTWKDDSIKPGVGTSQQYVIFTPDDTANYNTVEFQIDVTIQSASGNSSTNNASMQTTVQNGTANTVLSSVAGSQLVRQAVASQSDSIVIEPEITSDVTKTQVSIPASTVSQINSRTDAALTVASPIADVTIPNAALDTLSSAGGTVKVVTEQVDQSVVLTLTAGGKSVESVPGGLTLAVPVEEAGPGTVAVLVRDDGTRETLQKSVVEDGRMNIPLEGSATVEIMDNSKDFDDVEPTSWAADAVAFASARELFNGTSETTFSPDAAMSRGMLATVLYNLEGHPDQDAAATFSDVSGDAWYADGVAWAAENGITSGYGDGQFGPDDSITREQFAVMLWKYAGSPETSGEGLGFTDADQASGYALEALRWATANGILSGYGDGQLDPGGTATRAQAAQMLKNFMENT